MLLYSWRFSRYSAPIHWLVHGHMTSNNETVSRQIPLAGNIAKTMTSNGKQFTVTREMLTAVARDGWNLSAVFKFCFCFVLLYNCFEGNKIHCSPRDQSLSVNYCSWWMLTLAVTEYWSRSFMLIDSLVEMPKRVTNIAGITPATFKFVNYWLFVDQRGLDFFMFEIFSNFWRNEDCS